MIFIAFLVPLALYLFLLGYINRQPRPFMVSGTWDLIGLLFAVSGFVVLGGPAILSGLHERWRLYWIFAEGSPIEDLSQMSQTWVFLSIIYFVAVLTTCAWLFWRSRHLTSVYNTDQVAVEQALADTFQKLDLHPVRSGNLYIFGLQNITGNELTDQLAKIQELSGQTAILEVEPFAALRHVTLRWEPTDSPIRPMVEKNVQHCLDDIGAPEHETGLWLTTIGLAFLAMSFLGVIALIIRAWVNR